MSLLFSQVTLRREDGTDRVLYESGNPDEYDMRELLKSEDRYAAVRSFGLNGLTIQVQHYRFLGGSSRDWLAEAEHIAYYDSFCVQMKLNTCYAERYFPPFQQKFVFMLSQT